MRTLADIETLVYGKMGVGSDSSVFDAQSVVRPRIAAAYQNVCVGQIKDVFRDYFYAAPKLRILSRQVFVTVPDATVLSAGSALGASSLTLANSANFPASGAVFVEGEVLPYVSNSANVLTLTSPAESPHTSGAQVSFAYAVPEGFHLPVDCMLATDGTYIEHLDDRDPNSVPNHFTVKPGVGDSGDFLWWSIPGRFRVTYVIRPDALSASADTSVLPDEIDENVIAPLVAGGLLYETYADDPLGVRGQGQLRSAYAALTAFYAQQAIKSRKFRNKVKTPNWTPIPSAR